MNKYVSLISTVILISLSIVGCKPQVSVSESETNLMSGPMIGHVSMRSASVWAQVDMKAELCLLYWE
ncbi:MAG TPA: hypothetical protein EYN64_05495, partial [Flavobacteriales bacterium]|nr:hypothetical protein [Flavobacteriales bacterium]